MTELLIDHLATYDAEQMRRLLRNGEPLNTTAAQFGYTPAEAEELLEYAENNLYILEGWFHGVSA